MTVSASFSAAHGARFSPSRDEFWRMLEEMADREQQERRERAEAEARQRALDSLREPDE